MDRPSDIDPPGKHDDYPTEPGEASGRVQSAGPDTTYSQHRDDPTTESNPAGNPEGALLDVLHSEKIDREELLRNLDKLSNLELVRLSRSSYLKHANRYRVSN